MKAKDFRRLRKSAGLSMKEVAELFDTSYRTWQAWERGENRVSGIAVVALKMYLRLKDYEKLLNK